MIKGFLGGILCVTVLGSIGCVSKHQAPPPPPPAPPKISADEMQKLWMSATTPNENHGVLSPLVGQWTAQSTFWSMPDAPPETTSAKATNKWIYGGRYVEGTYEGTWNGHPFVGRVVWGYDNVAGKYQSSWIDSMSTSQMISAGTYDPATKALTLVGEASCPITKGPMRTRAVYTFVDPNHILFEMYGTAPDGAEHKAMEIRYTRAGTHPKKSKPKKVKR